VPPAQEGGRDPGRGRSLADHLALGARRGAQLADLGAAVQERVQDAVQTMCEAEVEAVDVTIEELTDGD
jgi:hypothetical protein